MLLLDPVKIRKMLRRPSKPLLKMLLIRKLKRVRVKKEKAKLMMRR